MTEIGLVQTLWNPEDDSKVFNMYESGMFSFVDLLPTKYEASLLATFDWENLRKKYSNTGIEIRSIQGFFFHGDFSLCSNSTLWSNTAERVREALVIAEKLEARNLIIGAPSARYCEHPSPKSCMIEGLEVLSNYCLGLERRILLENLPRDFKDAFAGDLDSSLVSDLSVSFCLDIGNHFSMFDEYKSAEESLDKILPNPKVKHVQANLIDFRIASWVNEFLMKRGSNLESVSIEGPVGTLENIAEQLKGFLDVCNSPKT